MAWCFGALGNDVTDMSFQHIPISSQQSWVDIALQWNIRATVRARSIAQPAVGFIQTETIIDSHNGGSGIAHQIKNLRGTGPEVHQRYPMVGGEVGDLLDCLF